MNLIVVILKLIVIITGIIGMAGGWMGMDPQLQLLFWAAPAGWAVGTELGEIFK